MPGALLAALLLLAAAPAAAADAALSMEVPAGKSKHIRLRDLPAGAEVAVRVITSGRILVAMVGAKQLKRAKDAKPVFRGALERKLTFRVIIPESDHYYLLFNNRAGSEARDVEVEIRAVRGRSRPPQEKSYSPRPEKASMSPSASSI